MVAAGTGCLELEADRPRWAIREDGIRKATVVGKSRNAQKAIQKVGVGTFGWKTSALFPEQMC